MKKRKTAITKPLLTKTEKATIKDARRILKRLTAKYEVLSENAWKGGSDEDKALNDYVDELVKEHIDVDTLGCFIVL
jgi:hypothetical protein